jgi:hypothetical protein
LPPKITGVEGSVVQVVAEGGTPKLIGVVPGEPMSGVPVSLTKNNKIYYSDNKPAKLSDLKPGQLVRAGVRVVEWTQPPTMKADAVFIEKSVREIIDPKDAAEVAKEVDFATQYLLLYRWTGWSGYAQDRVWFTVMEEKGQPVVALHLVRPERKAGMAKVVQQPETRWYAVAKNARVVGGPLGDGTKITNAGELTKTFPGTK